VTTGTWRRSVVPARLTPVPAGHAVTGQIGFADAVPLARRMG